MSLYSCFFLLLGRNERERDIVHTQSIDIYTHSRVACIIIYCSMRFYTLFERGSNVIYSKYVTVCTSRADTLMKLNHSEIVEAEWKPVEDAETK